MNKKAKELIKNYNMKKHEENGMFIDCNEKVDLTTNNTFSPNTKSSSNTKILPNTRASSGYIYYYIAPGEKTEFHRIDCDEYWSHNAGSTLELWVIDKNGKLNIKYCGSEKGEPTILFKKGEIFASKLPNNINDGAFITCITVPRFSYDGFEIFKKEEILKKYPQTKKFWE